MTSAIHALTAHTTTRCCANVALRLAVLRATEDMEAAADMFRDLTIRASRDAFPVLASTEQQRTEQPVDTGRTELRLSMAVPDDILIALPSVRAACATSQHLPAATRRRSARRSPTRMRLRRTASVCRGSPRTRPSGWMTGAQCSNSTSSPLNCRAAASGSAQNIPDVTQDPGFQSAREGTLSEISVPVALEGMVVGIINLESPVERNYDARVSTVIAFAEHIGTVLANARLALARQLHQYATQIVTRAHDLSAQTTIILDASKPLNGASRAEIERAVKDIEERARGIRDFAVEEHPYAPADLPALTARALSCAGLRHVEQYTPGEDTWPRFPSQSAALAFDCLRHVFTNVQNQLPVEPRQPPNVRLARTEWGGRPYQVLQVRNETKRPPGATRAANAYRVPILDRQWRSPTLIDSKAIKLPRFGAYLAGNQARLLGGDVHLAMEAERVVRVTVMLPEPA